MPRKPALKAISLQRFYSVEEVADLLGVSDKTVRRRIAGGELVAHRIGRQLRISEDDFNAYVASRRRRFVAS